ncbi:MAG: BREX-3 system P-loop-containing protein BrxF [Bryobacterales bacterium]|nr:BREX-3 system P-loop-containing protein BrxF [Bryobacterales bacterium]
MSNNSTASDKAITPVNEAIQQASSQYFRLVILAGLPGSGKTAVLKSIGQRLGCQVVNVNLELSKRMLELTRAQRSRQVERLLKEVIAAAPGDVVLLDNLEILFDPALEVEPLRLLQVSSRNRTVVASWSGSYVDGTLTYAEPGHPEFVQFKKVDAVVIAVGSPAAN